MNTKKISIIQRINEKFLGKQFFIAVVANKGTCSYFVNSTIYRSKKEVEAYKKYITTDERMKQRFDFVGYYSFRSKLDFRIPLSGKPVSLEEAKELANK